MELRQLEYFSAICDELHFTRAADKLGITQPTLSHQIKALEDELGTPLFDRIGKRIALTQAGAVLKTHAAVVFGALRSAKDQIGELHEGDRGTISVGTLPGELNHLAASQLVAFNRQFPNIKIKISAVENVAELVVNNELDAAITFMPVNDERLAALPLYEERFYLAVAPDHPLANAASVPFRDAERLPVIWFPQDHKCRQLIEATCKSSGIAMNPIIETNTIESIFSLVGSGAGVSILSKSLIQLYGSEKIRAIPIVDPVLRREVVIVHNREKFIGRPVKAFIALLQRFVEEKRIAEQGPAV
ncbi:DNA-binding transcriptional regulator, LysR family [Paenibacillus sp. UNC496MF]|uniref:LysR family transcriptional regulator n=1 Tax=Paenibacillus sp. UNC496MF TaxID=1502753 RepID=UPI0008EFAB2D|nr:LysR family transcriptional regulator [Paenibacillus sp. UNC496MF]SFI35995.1 DNA-binding transcriptional regulator, LysR family [Paenibacillus sp. UNC496MF]